MNDYKIYISLPSADSIIDKFGLGPGGKIQTAFTNELFRLDEVRIPMRDRFLYRSGRISEDGTYLEYNSPYARVHWYGKVMKGPGLPREVTEKDMEYHGAPLRGPKWTERTAIEYHDELIRFLEEMAKGY